MTLTTSPALNTDDKVASAQDAEFDRLRNAPFETLVNVLLPVLILKVWFSLWEDKWIDTAVEVRILLPSVACQRPKMDILTREAVALRVTMMIGQMGRYFESMRAEDPLSLLASPSGHHNGMKSSYLVVRTRIAPALSSMLELTADVAVAST